MAELKFCLGVAAGALAFWPLSGLLARIDGLLLICASALNLGISGDGATRVLAAATGTLLWFAGHWHYALRHHEYKRRLIGYVAARWAPAWLDPTAEWAKRR